MQTQDSQTQDRGKFLLIPPASLRPESPLHLPFMAAAELGASCSREFPWLHISQLQNHANGNSIETRRGRNKTEQGERRRGPKPAGKSFTEVLEGSARGSMKEMKARL